MGGSHVNRNLTQWLFFVTFVQSLATNGVTVQDCRGFSAYIFVQGEKVVIAHPSLFYVTGNGPENKVS